MSGKITKFGKICVTYALVFALVFSFAFSSFVGFNITVSAETSSTPAVSYWEGNKPESLEGLSMDGEGTKDSPYQVTNPDQLWFAVNNQDGTKYFKVMNDININDVTDFNTWTDTNPEGVYDWNPTGKFAGNFDGNGKTIKGLYSSSTDSNIGLFNTLGDNAIITNVIIDQAYLSYTSASGSQPNVGGLAGSANNVTGVYIYGCIVKNSVIKSNKAGDGGLGGLIGSSYATGEAHVNKDTLVVENSYTVDNVISGSVAWQAGIVASYWSKPVKLVNCFTTDKPIGHQSTGTTALNCYVSGEEVAAPYWGGGSFTEGNVEKIDNADMKGAEALANMSLSANEWDVTDSYPVPKAYREVYRFVESDKVVEDTEYAGGTGTKADPYQITNAAQLFKAVNNTDATKFFKVMNDIVINPIDDFDTWSNSSNFVDWNPANTFAGTFDGNQKTITGLYASSADQYLGLFSRVASGTKIYDVVIDHAYVAHTASLGMAMTGGLIGTAQAATDIYIYGCIVRNSVIKGKGGAAGLVGGAWSSSGDNEITLKNCYAVDNTVTGASWKAGLVAARWGNTSATYIDCFTTDYTLGHQAISATITNCYVSGDVEYPFFESASTGAFEDGKVAKIENANMKGEDALTNMNLSAISWTAVENDYPLPVKYSVLYSFTDEDKDVETITFAGGTGTKADPYQITDTLELWKAVNNTDSSLYFKVMNDITINNISAFNEWSNSSDITDWNPSATFVGTFDGNQKTITGLYVSHASTANDQGVGLFGRVGSNANIHDVIIDHAYIVNTTTTKSMTGAAGIIGSIRSSSNVTVYGCIVKNSYIYHSYLTGESGAGGIIGFVCQTTNLTVRNCYAVDNTIGGCHYAAGIIGGHWMNTNAVVDSCFVTDYAIGHKKDDLTVYNCYVSDNVTQPYDESVNAFGTATNIYQVAKENMKGESAITSMNLSTIAWNAVENDYPLPVKYGILYSFTEEDKNIETTTFAGGTGTKADPYQITNAAQLFKAVNNTDATLCFKVMNDITINDISAFDAWADTTQFTDWNPSEIFAGTFDGNQKVITGLYSSGAYKHLGLFSRVASGTVIHNVIIDHAYLSNTAGSMSLVGGLVGGAIEAGDVYINGCIVKNSKILNKHKGSAGEGGLVGGAYSTSTDTKIIKLENCYAVDNILNGTCEWSSGLMAARWTTKSVMINCFTTDYALEHQPESANATNCYVSGDVEYPFSYSDKAAFGETSGIYKIDNANMKGSDALENMALSPSAWTAVDGDYPMPKLYHEHDYSVNGGYTCSICKDSKTPAAPTVETKTNNSVTLVAIDGLEYSLDGTTWQASNVFEGLAPNTEYTFYQRVAQSETAFASETSAGVKETTYKNTVEAPAAPTLEAKTSDSVTLAAVDGYEYSKDGDIWQESNVFENLAPNASYTFYQRVKETDTNYVSQSSEGLNVTTDKLSVAKPAAPTVDSKTNNSVTLVAIDGLEYSLGGTTWQVSNVFTDLAPNTEYTFYQRVAQTDVNDASETSDALIVTTNKNQVASPDAPVVEDKTSNSITVVATDGYEYSIDRETWQTSNVFEGLSAGATYTVYQRVAETDTDYASEMSVGTVVVTLKLTVSAPEAPTVESKTYNSVTLVAIDGYEYSLDGEIWQDSNIFEGLQADTEYTFYQRIAETGDSYVSPSSLGVTEKTLTKSIKNGWVYENDKWAYYENDVKATNCWKLDSVGWCYLGSDGYMRTNAWIMDSQGWCYVGADGYCLTNAWMLDSVGWCYLNAEGRMATNSWILDSVGWCYVGADGYCVTNAWMKDSVGWCYLDAEGRMATNRWVMDSVGWCYVGADGYAVTNCWKQDSHGWCYLNSEGSMTKSAWVLDGGVWYYLDGNGYMVTGWQYIGGTWYNFASSGAWIG